ncbi:hypothetical protein MUK42_28193 [Musa troglodytarum]|uniref:NAC domain-containing protein n=1 Tax=Musa troglodytarum TaxID=320322 RepID=A0A9E7F1J5_9LILI|nr:hypothetical protein MUK42_28193 [Musa troglodytarum]
MHEYRLHPSLYATIPSYETEEIILCRIRHKGKGPADDGDGLAPKAPPLAEPSLAAPATLEEELRMPAPATQDAMADFLVCCRVPYTRAFGKEPWDSAAMLEVEEEAWTSDEIHEFHKMLELDDLPAEATAAAETAFAPPVAETPMVALETQSADPGCPPLHRMGSYGRRLAIDELLGEFRICAPATELSLDPSVPFSSNPPPHPSSSGSEWMSSSDVFELV